MSDRTVVVVVSTDVGIRAHVRLTLGDDRFAVHDAPDTAAAAHRIAEQRPSIVILDLDLPEDGAAALARSVRSQPETQDVRTLLLVPRRDAALGDPAGTDAQLLVPSTSFALLSKVDRLLPA